MPETYTTLSYTDIDGRAKVRYFVQPAQAQLWFTNYLFATEQATASFGTTK